MGRLFHYAFKKSTSSKMISIQNTKRAGALFFALVYALVLISPPATAYAAQHKPDPTNSHIQPKRTDDKKKMAQNYAGSIAPKESPKLAAADAVPDNKNVLNKLTNKSTPIGEPLQGLNKDSTNTPAASRELTEKRTANSSVILNKDGTITERQYLAPKFFKNGKAWDLIDTSIIEDTNAGDAGTSIGQAWGTVQSLVTDKKTFKVKGNDWQARFAPSDAKQGMLRVGKGNDSIAFTPTNAAKDVTPAISTNKDGYQVVRYKELWKNVDVEYIIETNSVKENIILKNRSAANSINFTISGASLQESNTTQKFGNFDVKEKKYILKGALDDAFSLSPANLILNNYGFVSDAGALTQKFEGNSVSMTVDQKYLNNLPDNAFPAVIDPSTFYSTVGTRDGGNYLSFKSDGSICYSNVCNPYAGSLYDSNNTLRYWRSAFFAPYDQLNDSNKTLSNATLHLQQRSNESFWTGNFDTHTYYVGHANCLNNYGCTPGFNTSGQVAGGSGDINVTSIYQNRIGSGDFGAWLMLDGNDGSTTSFKNFDPGTGPYNSGSYISFTYNGPPASPTIESPTNNEIFADPQPSFSVAYAENPNGGTPLQYQMRVSSGSGGSGFLIASPVLASRQWTIPDNVLQDGSTYYVQARSFDPISQLYSTWGASTPFRIDMRTGSDNTQSYDALGPVSVNLATGNLSTSASTHASTAQGGSLGASMSYNTPLKSRPGLVGEYWKVAANYSGGAPTTTPDLTRVDQNVDFNWDTGTPLSDPAKNDWYYARWTGNFTAPKTGSYQFGGQHDDLLQVYVDNVQVYSNGGCYYGSPKCYGSSVSLQEGQVVSIRMQYLEATGPAYANVYVKGPVSEQTIPRDWLSTDVRPVNNSKYGLRGSYYARLDGTNTFSANNYKMMERVDPYLSFNWGTASPVANGPSDFLVRWTGYVTVPVTTTYNFGSRSDDGTKIYVGASNTVALDDWAVHGPPATPTWGSTSISLAANTPTKITVEYFDSASEASFELWIKSTGTNVPQQIIPSSWLTTDAQILPDGWKLGIDGSGTARYNYLSANQNSAILTDSTGSTHEYAWTGSGYKPPVNEDGSLVRNADGTYTLQDSDGQTYVFGTDGSVSSVTSASDDRNPAALKYEYQSLNGGPVHLYKIKDGVNTARDLTLYYSGQAQCGSAPSTYDANAPAGMVCAAKTNDARTTYLYYKEGQLAEIALPGNAKVDYGYEKVLKADGSTVGYRLKSVRDALANDAIAAGVRTNNDNVMTQIGYDSLGRVTNVTLPAPTESAARVQHTIEYLPEQKAYVDANGSPVTGYSGLTKQHVVGASEPKGYTRRIKFDNLYRTIESTDSTGLSSTMEWNATKDLAYSATDPTGLKSTTIYNDEDRPISTYGPAPKAWFTTGAPNNQIPLSTYTAQVPRSDVGYDEGIVGPAVGWFDYTKQSANPSGALTGAPKLHTTGINPSTPGTLSNTFASPPITATSGAQGIGFSAVGKLRLVNGTYTISADVTDGLRVWVDDSMIINQWVDATSRTVTSTTFTVSDATPKRMQIDGYRRTGATGTLNIKIAQSGGFAATTNWSTYLKPGYGLTTSSKVYDSTIGDSTSTVNYGSTPELGLPQSMSIDQSALNLTSTAAYEAQGTAGTFLRPTNNKRPGDATANPAAANTYYTATETRDNPCTTAVEAYKQAGLVKKVTEASPNNGSTLGRTTETVYDDAGRIVATKTNSDGWTCITYDTRGRIATTTIPDNDGTGPNVARTTTNNHATYGDPTTTSVDDGSGATATQTDLLGRVIYYHDSHWNETWTTYDSFGRPASRTSDVGVESYVYDEYSRLTQQKLDATPYALITYDQYNRVTSLEYPNANGQKMVVSRDTLGRVVGQNFYAGGSATPGSNLLANASVEDVSSGDVNLPNKWHHDSWGTNTTAFTYLNEGYTGNRSVKTEMTAHTDGDAKWYADTVNVSANTTYIYKDYYKSNIATEAVVEYTHQNASVTYEWLGNIAANASWTQSNLSFTTPATASKATVYHIVGNVGWLMTDDAELYAGSTGSQTVIASDQVVRSQSGRIVSGTENGQSKAYTYDKAGRLTAATIGSNSYSYGYGAQSGTCASGTNANSGKNFNRTSQSINGASSTFCYDYADRLISSSDALANSPTYDSHGNMITIGSGTSPLRLYYDSSDRNSGVEQYNASGNGNATYYSRDVQNRISFREVDTIASMAWTTVDEEWYGFTGNGSGASFVRNAAWDVTEKYLSLPGGVSLTIRPQQTGNASKVYSLSNLQGHIMATTDASGTLTGTFRYDPYGNKISTTLPNNSTSGSTLGWAGGARRVTETSLALTPIQMGARVYLPTIGRFAQKDPVVGGNANDYAYAIDPINSNDFSGKILLQGGSGIIQGGAGATLQNAAGASRVQPAAPAPYYQPAFGLRAVQTTAKVDLTIVRTPAPTQNNSTRMPATTVVLVPQIQNIGNLMRINNPGASSGAPYAPSGQDPLRSVYREVWLPLGGAGVGCFAGGSVYARGGAAAIVFGCGIGAVAGFKAGETGSDVLDAYDGVNDIIENSPY